MKLVADADSVVADVEEMLTVPVPPFAVSDLLSTAAVVTTPVLPLSVIEFGILNGAVKFTSLAVEVKTKLSAVIKLSPVLGIWADWMMVTVPVPAV